jgi:cysteinyl-tRNA synthetase
LTDPVRADLNSLKAIRSWGLLLQNVSVEAVQQSPFDLVVIEPQLEEDYRMIFSRQSVAAMKQAPHTSKKRLILAYLSIGEAEDYRPYWQQRWKKNPPAWLGKLNPNWDGNYKVRYWLNEWQVIILHQLEAIVASGFDGVYLDIVDAWDYWSDSFTYTQKTEIASPDDPVNNPAVAATLMFHWLQKIRHTARYTAVHANPGFLLIPQNGENLLSHLTEQDRKAFWDLVDGIGVESVFFYGDQPENNPLNVEKERLHVLSQFIERGKTVLAIEYLTEPDLTTEFFTVARRHRFVPYAGVKFLDRFGTSIQESE